MKVVKQFLGGIFLCLAEVLVGILLMINPVGFTSGIITACGIVLLMGGLVCVIKYFRMDAATAAISQELLKGLVLLLVGAFCIMKSNWFIATLPLLTLVYGIAILLSGLSKIQWTVNMLRMKKGKWVLAAVSAVVSIVCAVMILSNLFVSTVALGMFAGISLICEALIDLVTFLISGKKKEEKTEQESAAQTVEE